jgi:hypothetical protein
MCRRPADEHLVGLIRHMMRPDAKDRPRASDVEEQIALIGGIAKATGGSEFSQPCCGLGMFLPEPDSPGEVANAVKIFKTTFKIIHGNTHMESQKIGWHHVKYFVDVQYPRLVERVHLYAVSADPLAHVPLLIGDLASKLQPNLLRSGWAAFRACLRDLRLI